MSRKYRNKRESQCWKMAGEMVKAQYERYDALWNNRMRISGVLLDHGRETIRDINDLMPNFLTYSTEAQPADEVASDFGFEDVNELVEYLLAYRPRGPVRQEFYEQLLSEWQQDEGGASDVPF